MEKKYVVRYQGGSGGFLVAWLLQMTVQSDCFDSALQCFHHSLKNNSIEWKNYEITPPNIAVLCNSFFPDRTLEKNHIVKYINSNIEKIANDDSSIDSYDTLQTILKCYLNNEVYRETTSIYKSKFSSPLDELLDNIWTYSRIVYSSNSNLFVTSSEDFINLANQTKASGTYNLPNHTYISPILNKYKDKLNLFPIESVWKGGWQDYIEKFIGKKLTPHQRHRCLTIISRWLEIQPTEIKKYINL